jgi:hypothetical protein
MDKGAGDVGHRIAIDQQQVGTCSRCDTPSVGESEALLTTCERQQNWLKRSACPLNSGKSGCC